MKELRMSEGHRCFSLRNKKGVAAEITEGSSETNKDDMQNTRSSTCVH